MAAWRKTLGFKASWPGFIEPALASSVDKVPGGERWIHEIKFDGYRIQLHLQNGQVKVLTRRGNDWTDRFRKIAADASEIVRMLAFRDRLRTHDDERRLYETTKRELAARDWTFVQQYADAKGAVVEAIIARALADEGDDAGAAR